MSMKRRLIFGLCVVSLMLATACRSGESQPNVGWGAGETVTVNIRQRALTRTDDCVNRFVAHALPFATGTRIREIRTYESNGAGLAINDLDDDGDLDLVFASVDREAAILWSEGGLTFRSEPLEAKYTRAANIVDVDGDGLLDIVFTHRGLQPPSFWRNQGGAAPARFVQATLPGVESYAYSMAWADLNGDGALDLVTGSYNVDLKQQGIDLPEADPHAGIHYYQRINGQFEPQLLSPKAEALAVGLVDLNGDRQLDIWVANDFVLQDQFWLRGAGAGAEEKQPAWTPTRPFNRTSHSTMSIDWGDLDNDGRVAFLTTDMNPDDLAVETMAAWLPVISKLEQPHGANDPQIMANVLQVANRGGWANQAPRRGMDATGWSWAGKFGDLDNDGWLDLYIVNGMIATNLFVHLPNAELVEANKAFRNQGDGAFRPAPEWNLGSLASGRGMMMADLDGDGDLDIVVNNLRASAQLFENQLCAGDSIQVDLRWPGSGNTRAIGAQVRLLTDHGTLTRDVRAASGYLSGDPARIHFGFPVATSVTALEIRWPDGAVSRVEQPAPQTLLEVTR
jgi:hypothetical protein